MQKIDLRGDWTLHSKQRLDTTPALVPGDTHSALLNAGKIPDPYWGLNELQLQGLAQEDWIYERSFEISASLLDEESVFLNCESLDTVATVFINDQEIAKTRNMFVRHRFEVKNFLKPGTNQIRIELDSAERAALEESRKLRYPIPYSGAPVESPHRNLLRKVQCHAGWDWGPCFMVAGLYGELFLGATSTGRIEHVYTKQTHGADGVELEVTCEVESPKGGASTFEIEIGGQKASLPVELRPGINILRQKIRIPNPELWWPNDYGAQPLYDLSVKAAGDTLRKRLGLRTLVVENKEDQDGLSLTFIVNGVPVFCKGASWIPADALPERQTRAVLDDLLTSAAQAHMNMIRVWGGGQYESEDFYDLCDEKGLLVWQDFMFACALYPSEPQFLASVRGEAQYQVKRLRDHASLALWCGNNENVGGWRSFPQTKGEDPTRYCIDYDRLNEGVLGDTVRQFDPSRTFWPSSPCAGSHDYSNCWHDNSRGDMHFWDVWHGGKPFEAFLEVKPRFCSEFGYQSFPSLDTIRTYAPPDQWNATSPILEHHQRSGTGNTRITENFTRYFRVPEGFASFVYLSQVQQGIAIKTAVEHWRRLRPFCMGTLYWQLNDLWPVCSWASLEYGGKWKLLHYMAKRFFAPVLVSAFHDKENVEVWANNDGVKPVVGSVLLRVVAFAGQTLHTFRFDKEIPAGSSIRLQHYRVKDLAPNVTDAFLSLEWSVDGSVTRNEHFFCEYKKCTLLPPEIATEVCAVEGGFAVTLRSNLPALWVSANVDAIRGEFDDNCFTLLPNEARTLTFTPKESVTLEKLQAQLRVQHLRGTYA